MSDEAPAHMERKGTWANGLTAEGADISLTLVSDHIVKQWGRRSYMAMIKPRMPLKMAVEIIARGRVLEAFFNSSDMCVAASAPRREVMGPNQPTRQARPAGTISATTWTMALRETLTASPATLVAEDGPDFMRGTARSKNPQRNNDGEKAGQVQEEDQSFHEREMSGEKGVEDGDKDDQGDGHQTSMPPLILVAVHVQNDETLDLGRGQEATNGASSLPPEDAQPADKERKRFLHAARGEF